MFKRLSHAILIFTVILTVFGQWGVLQSLAWTSMLVNNLHSCSLEAAVARTFDGRHPCCLCKAIAAHKQSEQKKDVSQPLQKLEFPPLKTECRLIAPAPCRNFPPPGGLAAAPVAKPPTPPPRSAFA